RDRLYVLGLLVYVIPDDSGDGSSVCIRLVEVLKILVPERIFEQISYPSEWAVYSDECSIVLNEKFPDRKNQYRDKNGDEAVVPFADVEGEGDRRYDKDYG